MPICRHFIYAVETPILVLKVKSYEKQRKLFNMIIHNEDTVTDLCFEFTNCKVGKKKLRNTTSKMKKNNSLCGKLIYIILCFTTQLEQNNGYSIRIIQLVY